MKTITFSVLNLLISLNIFAQAYYIQVIPYGKKQCTYIDLQETPIEIKHHRKCYPFSKDGISVILDKEQFAFLTTSGEILETDVKHFNLIRSMGIQGFHNGLVAIRVNNKWGYLDTLGTLVIPLKYDFVSVFNGGYAVAIAHGTKYVINTFGEETPIEESNIYVIKRFSEGLAIYCNNARKYGFINTKGKVLITPQFKSVGYFVNGLAWARNFQNKIGYIDTTGVWVISPRFISARNFDKISGLARVKTDSGWAYVNRTGDILKVNSTRYWGDFHEGLARGRSGDFFGFYDNTGTWVIEAKFQKVRNFHNGYAAAKINDKWGLINNLGDWIIQPNYAYMGDMARIDKKK